MNMQPIFVGTGQYGSPPSHVSQTLPTPSVHGSVTGGYGLLTRLSKGGSFGHFATIKGRAMGLSHASV